MTYRIEKLYMGGTWIPANIDDNQFHDREEAAEHIKILRLFDDPEMPASQYRVVALPQ